MPELANDQQVVALPIDAQGGDHFRYFVSSDSDVVSQAQKVANSYESDRPWDVVVSIMATRGLEKMVRVVPGPDFVNGNMAGTPLAGTALAYAILRANEQSPIEAIQNTEGRI
jgi:hypothetical protein